MLFLPTGKGKPAALDASIISSQQQLAINGASTPQGYTLSMARARKMAAQSGTCHKMVVLFIPTVVVIGGLEKGRVRDYRDYWPSSGQHLEIPRAESTHYMFYLFHPAMSMKGGKKPIYGFIASLPIPLHWIGRLGNLFLFCSSVLIDNLNIESTGVLPIIKFLKGKKLQWQEV